MATASRGAKLEAPCAHTLVLVESARARGREAHEHPKTKHRSRQCPAHRCAGHRERGGSERDAGVSEVKRAPG